MIPLSLRDIAGITGAGLDQVPDPAAVVTGPVTIDSRAAAPGALFAALPGSRADGHDFAARRWPRAPPRCWPPARAARRR